MFNFAKGEMVLVDELNFVGMWEIGVKKWIFLIIYEGEMVAVEF